MKRRLLLTLSLVAFITLSCLGSEFAARLYVSRRDSSGWLTNARRHWPDGYLDEMGALARSWQLGEDGYWHSDFKGKWINVDNDLRRTLFQPAAAPYTLYIFGSSTTFNAEVADEYTIASQLQKRLRGYRVVNMGHAGVDIKGQLARLQRVTLRPGDIVIFYDGMTDIDFPLSVATRRSWLITGQLCARLPQQMALVQLYCEMTDNLLPGADVTPDDLTRLDSRVRVAIEQAKTYARSHDAAFWHFIQPHLFSHPLSVDEQRMADNPNLVPVGLDRGIKAGWPVIQAACRAGCVDLTYALDGLRANGVDLYFDYDHTTERGNAVIAKIIFDYLTIY